MLQRTHAAARCQRATGSRHDLGTQLASLAPQVYAVALYVEAERAAKELGVRKRGGFFDDNRRDPSHVGALFSNR